MTRSATVLAALSLATLAGCVEIDTPIATPFDIHPPGPAVLGPPAAGAPVDPRFADALTAYAGAARVVPAAGTPQAQVRLRQALRALADAVALVPAQPAVRQRTYDAANELRVTVALMATRYAGDLRAQTAQARGGLERIARLLHEVAVSDYAGSPEVLERARALEDAVRAIRPDDQAGMARLKGALGAAERALEAMMKAAIAAA